MEAVEEGEKMVMEETAIGVAGDLMAVRQKDFILLIRNSLIRVTGRGGGNYGGGRDGGFGGIYGHYFIIDFTL